jgi:2,3-dihydroxybenzoate-AMP ligase
LDDVAIARAYLDGAIPYPPELIAEYRRQGWWYDDSYVDLFRRAVQVDPEREGLVDDHRRLRWRDVEEEVARLAGALASRGVGRHDRVLLQLPTRAEYPIAFHAAQHLGAVPVVAIPRMGLSELRPLLELAEPSAWIFARRDGSRDLGELAGALRREGLLPRLAIAVAEPGDEPAGTLQMGGVVAEQDGARSLQTLRSLPAPDPNDVAAIFLTGGATGRSKAVPRTHNSFVGNMRVLHQRGSSEDVPLIGTPVGHGMANQGALGGWVIHGSRLVMVGSPRAERVLQVAARERATSMSLVPTQLADLLDLPDLDRYDLGSVRRVIASGGFLTADLARRARAFCERRGIWFGGSAYGCTEGPAIGHAPDESEDQILHTVGRPAFPGHEWRVLDPVDEELPAGDVGQLAVRGPSVFTGYYRAPEDNRDIFTPSGLYKTGDLGFIDGDGFVHLTGRLKDVIQRGGEAVVPTEVEELVLTHPDVARVAVVAMPDRRLGERACAYVVLRPGTELTLEGLVAHLRARGAGPLQLPERLELIDRIPETPAAKIDRVRLRADIARKVAAES